MTKGTAPGLLVMVAVLYRHCVVTSLHVIKLHRTHVRAAKSGQVSDVLPLGQTRGRLCRTSRYYCFFATTYESIIISKENFFKAL